jgi:hypothetical protein
LAILATVHIDNVALRHRVLSAKIEVESAAIQDAPGAVLYAADANAAHGLRRTNANKRHAVTVLLDDDEWD